ncbi:multiple drug resistance-associated protein-like transporter 1 [[Candida] railenensis]|uniref:Multiple drug resistance-associated protein-like transporter 1 n=1 Tax=[Candida] railenensis TaxID=45579 RepID=A0A9P0QLM1_9ASCO|nr:multiple drug resistance-associated protein-like transporter 1 [[Candida] railenensis]
MVPNYLNTQSFLYTSEPGRGDQRHSNFSSNEGCSLDSIFQPLYKPNENHLNPCFIALVTGYSHIAIALFILFQIANLIFNNTFGHHKIKYSFGSSISLLRSSLSHLAKVSAIVLQVLFVSLLLGLNLSTETSGFKTTALLLVLGTLLFAATPLHFIEPTRSVVPSASLLIFWTIQIIVTGIWVVQDAFSPIKLFAQSNAAIFLTIETLIFINAVTIFNFEFNYYTPTRELVDYFELNEWDITSEVDFYSYITFLHAQPAMKQIYINDSLDEDTIKLPGTPNRLKCEYTQPILQGYWDKELLKENKKDTNLFIPIIRSNLLYTFLSFAFSIAESCVSLSQPFLLRMLLLFFQQKTSKTLEDAPPLITGISIVAGMFLIAILRSIIGNQAYLSMFSLIFSIQTGLSGMIYEKSLRLSPEARKTQTTGDIINHLGTDVATLEELSYVIADVLNDPVRLLICLFSLYKIIGNATWGGFIVALILVPLSSKVSTSIFSLYNEGLEFKDARVRLTSEIFTSIKSVKLYSWEKPMLERLGEVRNDKEVKTYKRIGVFNAFSTFLWSCIPFCIATASFATFAYTSNVPLTPDKIFPALALFDMLTEPMLALPSTFANIVEIRVSLKRLREYFSAEELGKTVKRVNKPLQLNDVSIDLENISFIWNSNPKSSIDDSNTALKDINFTTRKGQLTCIVGKVGAGKSTLLKAILGEIPIAPEAANSIPGHSSVVGSIAYCSQSPWIMNATVKENIIFGCRYNKEFYDKAVDACELLSDFASLPDGDKTVVGEKGISLSGGQKARLSLARAVYARADVYLFDDVLSAVDAHVGKNIIKKVLGSNGILKTKTKVLATNSVNVLSESHNIVLLKSGKIIETGTYSEVMKKDNSDLLELIKEFGQQEKEHEKEQEIEENEIELCSESNSLVSSSEIQVFEPEVTENVIEPAGNTSRRSSIGAASLMPFGHDFIHDDEIVEQIEEDGSSPVKKTGHTKEITTKGKMSLKIYLEYFKACNYTYVFLYLILVSLTIGTTVLGKYSLKFWSEVNERTGENTNPGKYLGIYTFLGVIGSALTLIAAFVVWTYCIIRGSIYIHDKMANQVLRSPMSFFETTPIGRILNRFSEDINMIDQNLPWAIIDLLEYALNIIAVFLIIVLNLPIMGIIILVLMVAYNEVRKFFIPSSREIKRLKSAKKSPVFSHLQESVNGVESLRAYAQEDRFIYKNNALLNSKIVIDYMMTLTNRWLSMRLQFVSSLLLFSSGLLVVLTIGTSLEMSSGLVGFVMAYTLSITEMLKSIIFRWAQLEARSISLERLFEYCNLPTEAEMIIESNRPKESWPNDGTIEFRDYSTRYRENLDPVLRNVSLRIKPSEKIGIVGRTGAGKSSLTLAIFRIIESIGGNINIDGVDTSSIGLFDLRSNLSIIPQEAHTIEGSIRQNLDPFGNFSDKQLWKVLDLAHLRKHVESMKTRGFDKGDDDGDDDTAQEEFVGLDANVFEGGSNLSSGQKQLLCLARALLNTSKILILDEATAAVDVQTDKIIQDTIRTEFKDKTILTIAHRLDTIMDSDRVIVLDKGEVKEFDTIPELLAKKDGIFYSLCKEGGYLKNE